MIDMRKFFVWLCFGLVECFATTLVIFWFIQKEVNGWNMEPIARSLMIGVWVLQFVISLGIMIEGQGGRSNEKTN